MQIKHAQAPPQKSEPAQAQSHRFTISRSLSGVLRILLMILEQYHSSCLGFSCVGLGLCWFGLLRIVFVFCCFGVGWFVLVWIGLCWFELVWVWFGFFGFGLVCVGWSWFGWFELVWGLVCEWHFQASPRLGALHRASTARNADQNMEDLSLLQHVTHTQPNMCEKR